MQVRTPKVVQARLRNGISMSDQENPLVRNEPPTGALGQAWRATCRIITPTGKGSGFFLEGAEGGGLVVATNAHVVAGCSTVDVEVLSPDGIQVFQAELMAIDYPHDLALLAVDMQLLLLDDEFTFSPTSLRLGKPPSPGEEIWVCGFPFGAETPSLIHGYVAGYDACAPYGYEIASVVLDATVNSGNSGGPVVDAEGSVIGVVHAAAAPLFLPTELLAVVDDATAKAMKLLRQILRANTGIGYALDPMDLESMLETERDCHRHARRVFQQFPPAIFPMSQKDFVALQIAALDTEDPPSSASPIGVFSCDRAGEIYLGWYGQADCRLLELPERWRQAARAISWSGGSFMLRGYDVLLYRQRYKGFVVPVRFQVDKEP